MVGLLGKWPPSFAEWHAKVSNLLFCFPTLSVTPQTGRLIDTHVSFFNLSSSLTSSGSASSWTSVSSQSAHSCLLLALLPCTCTLPQTSAGDQQAFPGPPTLPQGSQASNLPLLPTSIPNLGLTKFFSLPTDSPFVGLQSAIERRARRELRRKQPTAIGKCKSTYLGLFGVAKELVDLTTYSPETSKFI